MSDARKRELAANLAEVRAAIEQACAAAGRDSSEVTLIAVTKTWPATDIRMLAELGLRDFGENRDQEAATKAAELSDLGLRWHFIGQLQTNKARSVSSYAHYVHSVDRERLVSALAAGATAAGRAVGCLLQVSLDAQPGRGGAMPAELAELAELVARSPGLTLAGLMAVAPLGEQPDAAFARLAGIWREFRAHHPTAGMLSAGMTGDFEAAIRHGATHLRIGSALLGNRPALG